MPRPLPPKYRQARTIKAGHEIYPPYGTWVRVDSRQDCHGSDGRLFQIVFHLADGSTFHAVPSQEIESRYEPA